MRLSIIVILLCCQFYQINTANAGRILHVNIKAPNASDKNPGTEAAPWKTLEHAGKSAVAGDRVIIHPGIYKGTLDVKTFGTKDNPISFEGAELGKVILDGTEPVINWKRSKRDPRIWEAGNRLKLKKYPLPHVYSKFYNNADPRDLSVDGAPLFLLKNQICCLEAGQQTRKKTCCMYGFRMTAILINII